MTDHDRAKQLAPDGATHYVFDNSYLFFRLCTSGYFFEVHLSGFWWLLERELYFHYVENGVIRSLD